MARESRWALKTRLTSLSLEFVAIRLAMARAMTHRDGEDVCGCRMATIDCVVSELLLVEAANGLTWSDLALD
jgi:hypothetical protein